MNEEEKKEERNKRERKKKKVVASIYNLVLQYFVYFFPIIIQIKGIMLLKK